MLKPSSTVVLVSDGFDTDSASELVDALRALRRRCHRLLWLNPMLGREGYALHPDMLAALTPHVDRIAAAHSLDALREAVLYLASGNR